MDNIKPPETHTDVTEQSETVMDTQDVPPDEEKSSKKSKNNVQSLAPERRQRPQIQQVTEVWRRIIDRDDQPNKGLGAWLYSEFAVLIESDGHARSPVLVDTYKKVVKRVDMDVVIAEMLQVSSVYFVNHPLEELRDYAILVSMAREIASYWLMTTQNVIRECKPVAFESDDSWTFSRIGFDPLENITLEDMQAGAHAWVDVINRLSNSDAFCAWVWSLFIDQGDRRQYVWLCGEGRTGKSQIAETIAVLLGDAVTTANSGVCTQNNWTYSLLAKRLCIVSEANANFPASDLFKSVTGDNRHRVTEKYMKPFDAFINTKFLFISNDQLQISSDKAAMSRAILCELLPYSGVELSPVRYREKLAFEMQVFISYCKHIYEKRAETSGHIESDMEALLELANERDHKYFQVLEYAFELDEGARTPAKDVQSVCSKYEITGVHYQRFKAWLLRTHPKVQNKLLREGGCPLKFFVGIKLKDTTSYGRKQVDESGNPLPIEPSHS